jgi:hypothetical protein
VIRFTYGSMTGAYTGASAATDRRCPRDQQEITMFTRITFAAIAAALIVSAAPVLGGQSAGETITKVSKIAAQGWCSGPRQHTDFRCS